MERHAFSRATDYLSINYTVSSLKLQRAVTFLYHPRKMLQKAIVHGQFLAEIHLSLNSPVPHFSPVCLIEIGWRSHPCTKELWKLFWLFKRRCWKEIQALAWRSWKIWLLFWKVSEYISPHIPPTLLPAHTQTPPITESPGVSLLWLFYLVRISLKFLTHCLKYKWPPLWANRKSGWKQLSSSQTGVLGLELTNSVAWSLETERLPWQTRSTIITIWWKSFHEYVLHR